MRKREVIELTIVALWHKVYIQISLLFHPVFCPSQAMSSCSEISGRLVPITERKLGYPLGLGMMMPITWQ